MLNGSGETVFSYEVCVIYQRLPNSKIKGIYIQDCKNRTARLVFDLWPLQVRSKQLYFSKYCIERTIFSKLLSLNLLECSAPVAYFLLCFIIYDDLILFLFWGPFMAPVSSCVPLIFPPSVQVLKYACTTRCCPRLHLFYALFFWKY